jgi:hypothetical protein
VSRELLDLSTVVDRDTVRIRTKKNPKGNVYELLNMEELSAFEFAILSDRHKRTRNLVGRTDRKMTPAEKRTVTKALKDILAQIVIDLEPTVLRELDMSQASKVVAAWALKYQDDDSESDDDDSGAAEGDSPRRSTTAGSSRSSNRSTAATPRTGSSRSRRGS